MGRFKQVSCRQWFVVFFLVTFSLVSFKLDTGPVYAGDADALAKQADKQLRDAERKMFNGENEEALQLLVEASSTINELKAADPTHKKLNSLENKYSRTKKTIDKKLGKTSTPPPTGTKKTAAQPSSGSTSDKLPGGVSKRLRDIDRELDTVERMVDQGSLKNAKYKFDGAATLFAEIDEKYGSQFSPEHPDYAAAKNRYAAVEGKIKTAEDQQAADKAQDAQAEEAQRARSDEWIKKFAPYITNQAREGHDPDKYLYYPGTTQPDELKKMQQVYEELNGLFAQYRTVEFPDGKTWELEQAEKDVQLALEDFSSAYASGAKNAEDAAKQNIDRAIAQLVNDTKWKSDPKEMPPIIDSKWQERINASVAEVEKMYSAGDPALVNLKEKQQQMIKLDQEHRQVWAQRTFVRPEIYEGNDLKDIRKQAESIVVKERPGAKILRVSVYKDQWKEEQVLEATDSTNTAIRYRVTRIINAQVAAKYNGKVNLLTLHIAKDKQSEGWTNLYGHIMYSDPMAEENVNKKGP
ncbi:MAG: hypothetical protein OEM01_04495 [Desulfobulbaceae bacterium]|nr:hypothetical protein [Desulfobulbaceae bacterium]